MPPTPGEEDAVPSVARTSVGPLEHTGKLRHKSPGASKSQQKMSALSFDEIFNMAERQPASVSREFWGSQNTVTVVLTVGRDHV